jgi:hypothetical protein
MSDKEKSKRPFGSLGQRLFGLRSKETAKTAVQAIVRQMRCMQTSLSSAAA